MTSSTFRRSALCLLVAAGLTLSPLAAHAAPSAAAFSAAPLAAAPGEGRGTLPSGSRYVLLTPTEWNGTLLVWSPGYSGSAGGEASAGPDPDVVAWALDEGYALAGSKPATAGWSVRDLLDDQPQLAAVAAASLGTPEHVVAWGSSMGGLTSVALLENNPDVFDGALPLCGSIAGAIPMLNQALDGAFALRMLLAPGDDRLELVDVQNEPARQAAFREVLEAAQATPEGRARIALAASLAQIPTWTQVGTPEPNPRDFAAQQDQLYRAFLFGVISPREPLESRAGGNFSWNTGVDYARSLNGSGNALLVRALYAEAGLSLRDDLGVLADADRIAADPAAVEYMQANATPTGRIAGPVLSLHETGDTAPTVAQAETYADRVRRGGGNAILRQAFVDRPGHCAFADAEVAAVVETLQERLDTGRWANLATPRVLDQRADRIADESGLDRGTGTFAQYRPDAMLRPERAPADR
ncbi:prolyl oligopeptidase family serine peptidase [Microbacterium caowuchunii]|uniref:prolyl oligopeptidase family serine peptidase n=1 Tax=Microbacterium caowuchunii TaxID=2614638 RepID=UPI00124803CA|nr:prolyl oligopeptidase family serine peptidase [Microbacterium caowuchunii]QEW00215.1 prolyl oligopeptidase family serine peptidase [Microbacterium caowuchunii]